MRVLAQAQNSIGLRKRPGVLVAEVATVPALFGWTRPYLILPKTALSQLTERELLMVLLHELAHVKRHDVLLNWLMLLAQALHWFNPLAWVWLRRLRADRELVCDAMVLRTLDGTSRAVYGGTLLKLLEITSGHPACASVVPVIRNKHEIERRIRMIPTFNVARNLNWTLTAALVIVVSGLTFTRAAGEKKLAAEPPPSTAADTNSSPQASPNTAVAQRVSELKDRITRQQQQVDRLRRELTIPTEVAEGNGSSRIDPEAIRLIERERISAQAAAARYQTLFKELKSKTPSQLVQAMPTAMPDAELTRLLGELNTAETQRARIQQQYGAEHPESRGIETTVKTVHGQIAARIEGILDGMSAQIVAQTESADALSKLVNEWARRDAEQTERFRPYFLAKRELEILEKVRDSLVLRLVEEQYRDLGQQRR